MIKTNKKIAIVHEWFSVYAGSEKVTIAIIELFKKAKIFCIVNFFKNTKLHAILGDRPIKSTFIQKLPFAQNNFRLYFPLLYWAVRSIKLKSCDVVITSSHAFAHSVKTSKNQIHICYCHTPMRYIWGMQDLYFRENGLNNKVISLIPRTFAAILRRLDYRTAQKVDYFIANSEHIKQKIKKYYRRDSIVIYPPVDIFKFQLQEEKKNYYFTSSRFVCYKKNDLIVKAFSKMPDKKLIICGQGKHKNKIKKNATPNIIFLDFLPFDEFHKYMREAKAFVFAAEEDFGIVLVEAQACGTPVIAYGKGGAAEIVQHKKTGFLYQSQKAESIVQAVEEFESQIDRFKSVEIRNNAKRFNHERFNQEFSEYVSYCINEPNNKA